MRKLFADLREQINRFIVQRDDFLMIASCSDNDSGIVLQILRDIEHSNASDVFILLSDSFVQTRPFVSVAIERLREQHSLACEALREKGLDPLAPFPEDLSDESELPHLRLRKAIVFARSLLPSTGGHKLVWAMFPQRIVERTEYLRFVDTFVPRDGVQPWMRGVRLIFRAEPGLDEDAPELVKSPKIRVFAVDLGTSVIEARTQEDAEDPELPEADRMQALLSLALLDYAHNRTDAAVAKYSVLLGYYQRTGNHLMEAFMMNAFGDLFHRLSDFEQAQRWYECSVAPASEAKDPFLLATIARNLGDVSYKLAAYGPAEEYYDGVDKLSRVTLDAAGKIRALEWRGLSQEKQGKQASAIESWEAAAHLSRKMNLTAFLKENLDHLRETCAALGLTEKLSSVEAELSTLELQETEQ
jgi:tetratricopeptide (TPR) repeat protein